MNQIAALVLLLQLSSPSWQTRDRAERLLYQTLPDSLFIVEAYRHDKCYETFVRCNRILNKYNQDCQEERYKIFNNLYKTMPWINIQSLATVEDQQLGQTCMSYASSVVRDWASDPKTWYPDYRCATQRLIREFIKQKRSDQEIFNILERFAEVERTTIEQIRQNRGQ